MPPIDLINQGFLHGEIKDNPVLSSPRDKSLQAGGMSRQSVDILRAGWPPDPLKAKFFF